MDRVNGHTTKKSQFIYIDWCRFELCGQYIAGKKVEATLVIKEDSVEDKQDPLENTQDPAENTQDPAENTQDPADDKQDPTEDIKDLVEVNDGVNVIREEPGSFADPSNTDTSPQESKDDKGSAKDEDEGRPGINRPNQGQRESKQTLSKHSRIHI